MERQNKTNQLQVIGFNPPEHFKLIPNSQAKRLEYIPPDEEPNKWSEIYTVWSEEFDKVDESELEINADNYIKDFTSLLRIGQIVLNYKAVVESDIVRHFLVWIYPHDKRHQVLVQISYFSLTRSAIFQHTIDNIDEKVFAKDTKSEVNKLLRYILDRDIFVLQESVMDEKEFKAYKSAIRKAEKDEKAKAEARTTRGSKEL